MVDPAPRAQELPGERVELVCPRCRFVIATFTAAELAGEAIKQKRYRALLTRQQLCGGCFCTVRKLEAVWDRAM